MILINSNSLNLNFVEFDVSISLLNIEIRVFHNLFRKIFKSQKLENLRISWFYLNPFQNKSSIEI